MNEQKAVIDSKIEVNDTVSFMSNNTKPIQYRSAKDDDDNTTVEKETVVTNGQV